jgi:CubicO group peptidase (beta-lactamase class C family)
MNCIMQNLCYPSCLRFKYSRFIKKLLIARISPRCARRLSILLALPLLFTLLGFSTRGYDPEVSLPATADGTEIECWQAYLSSKEVDGFSGAVIVAQGDKVLMRREYGVAAKDGKDTAFWIASISKTITATAVLKLAEDGLLDLYAPLSKLLPDIPTTLTNVTVHHLLTHRSGLPHAYSADGIIDRTAATKAIFQQKLKRKPGEFGYSNDGYNLLAILIETVSGETFENYLRRQIFKPAGMNSAGFWGFELGGAPIAPPLNPVRTLSAKPAIWYKGHSVANWGFRGASGIYATAEDLFRFARALESGRLLKKKTFDDMISSKNPSLGPNAQTYGYGWALRFKEGRLTEYWHGGNEDWLGHNGMLKVIGDRTYVVLTNSGDLKKESWAGHVEAGLHACEKN